MDDHANKYDCANGRNSLISHLLCIFSGDNITALPADFFKIPYEPGVAFVKIVIWLRRNGK